MELQNYRVRWEEIRSILIRTDSPEAAMELAMDYFYDKSKTEEQGCFEPFVDTPVDDEKIYLDPEYAEGGDDYDYDPDCPVCAALLTAKEDV